MTVVLDTNIFISALFWKGPPHEILKLAEHKIITIASAPQLLEELFGVLARNKFQRHLAETGINMEDIRERITDYFYYHGGQIRQHVSCLRAIIWCKISYIRRQSPAFAWVFSRYSYHITIQISQRSPQAGFIIDIIFLLKELFGKPTVRNFLAELSAGFIQRTSQSRHLLKQRNN